MIRTGLLLCANGSSYLGCQGRMRRSEAFELERHQAGRIDFINVARRFKCYQLDSYDRVNDALGGNKSLRRMNCGLGNSTRALYNSCTLEIYAIAPGKVARNHLLAGRQLWSDDASPTQSKTETSPEREMIPVKRRPNIFCGFLIEEW